MEYDLKIRQSYHGTGGREGYRFKVYNAKGKKLGELKEVPVKCNVGHTLSIDGVHYIVSKLYESPNPRDEKSEVLFYELTKFGFVPTFDLGSIMK
jgi:hypothetical protein